MFMIKLTRDTDSRHNTHKCRYYYCDDMSSMSCVSFWWLTLKFIDFNVAITLILNNNDDDNNNNNNGTAS